MKARWIIPIFAIGAIVMAVCVFWPSREPKKPDFDVDAALVRTEGRFAAASEEIDQAIADELLQISDFFDASKHRTPNFVKEVLGLASKWNLILDHMPRAKGGRHEAFLRESFEKRVFSTAELEQAIRQSVGSLARRVEGIESRLLINLRADLADLPGFPLPDFPTQAAFETRFKQALQESLALANSEIKADVATLLMSVVVEEVLTQAAVRFGVSSGILGAGATSGWTTLGIGLVIGVMVDQIISRIWDWWSDSEAMLTEKINAQLDQMEQAILEGDGEQGGLKQALQRFASERDRLRRNAIRAVLLQATGANP